MSLVGPRPERKYFIDKIMEHTDLYPVIYKMRPGLTSEATLYNGYTDTMEKMLRRLEMDISYFERRSLWLDFKIIIKTFINIVSGKKFLNEYEKILPFTLCYAKYSKHLCTIGYDRLRRLSEFIVKEHNKGTSQTQIVTKLMQNGVDKISQIRRVRDTYEKIKKGNSSLVLHQARKAIPSEVGKTTGSNVRE